MRIVQHPLRFLWLLALWVALWGSLSFANVASGVVVVAVVLRLFRLTPGEPHGFRIRPLATLRFSAYFLLKLVQANLVVAWEVITPGSRTNTGVVAVPLAGCSDAVITVVAHALSLTPGTVSIEVHGDPPVLYLHVLHLHDLERVRAGARRMARLALLAFGSPDALDAFDAHEVPA